MEIRVEDSGVGIKPAEREKIFQRFHMVDDDVNHKAVKGTGIGLFLPPIGVGFLLSAAIGGIPMERAVKPFLPFMAALLVGLVIVAAFPWLTLALPEAAGLLNRR